MIAPGIYTAMSNGVYHDDTDYLSSTILKRALPERYKKGGIQDALDFGTLFHTVVLEPDQLDAYVVLDAHKIAGNNPKTGKPYDAPHMTAKFKAAVAEAADTGQIVVSQEDWDRAHAMRDAIAKHPRASELLNACTAFEESAFWVDDNGVRHKARFDGRGPGFALDLKSTSGKPGTESLTRAVIDYGYDLSAEHYRTVAEGCGLDVDEFWFVFASKDDDHFITVCSLDDVFRDRGRILRALAIERLTDPAAAKYDGADRDLRLTPPPYARLTPTGTTIPADFTWSINDYS